MCTTFAKQEFIFLEALGEIGIPRSKSDIVARMTIIAKEQFDAEYLVHSPRSIKNLLKRGRNEQFVDQLNPTSSAITQDGFDRKIFLLENYVPIEVSEPA